MTCTNERKNIYILIGCPRRNKNKTTSPSFGSGLLEQENHACSAELRRAGGETNENSLASRFRLEVYLQRGNATRGLRDKGSLASRSRLEDCWFVETRMKFR